VTVGQALSTSTATVGKASIIVPADRRIRIDYTNSAGSTTSLSGNTVLSLNAWHSVELRETVGAGTGKLTLLLDGVTVASGASLDLGSQGVGWFAVGDKSAPTNSSIAGHLYLDDVLTNANGA
jgi:hypothetical protein